MSYFSATFLLKFEALGLIPWCFFSSVNLLYSKYFDLIAPIVVIMVVLLTVYLARCFPRLFRYFQESPIQAMCLLIMISFWSLASTSIQVLAPLSLPGIKGVRVNLKPDMHYFDKGHLAIWLISVVILILLLILILALISSHRLCFLVHHRVKPLLDEFQSCYKDNWRWYSGVYFICWTILQILILLSNYLLFQTFVIILTVTHCLLQPYITRWLNLMDGVLLACLSVTASLVVQDSGVYGESNPLEKQVIVYASIVLPLTMIAIGTVLVFLTRFGIRAKLIRVVHESWFYRKYSSRKPPLEVPPLPGQGSTFTTNSIRLNNSDDVQEREPLLGQLSNP